MYTEAIALYVEMIQQVIPYVSVFCICNMIVKMFLSAAFKGRIDF